jgi:predicted nucleotide-binding protein (sugar kinase/HSP70/actin superfamily)
MGQITTHPSFQRFHTQVKKFNLCGKTLLIPDMNPFSARLIASSFRAFDVDAIVMETYTGLTLGKEYTSGKECFPCQITLGDILHHLQKEKDHLGASFSPDRYVYFLPESEGPCRFGMYNKLQRLVLDQFAEYRDIPISYLTTDDGYSASGILPPDQARRFRKMGYVATIVADVMDRTVWRVRPYEYRPGITDAFMDNALDNMSRLIETQGASLPFHNVYGLLEDIVSTVRGFIDQEQPRRPRVGIVGEIYLRSHPDSNQNIIRQLEKFGAEVIDASIGEWVNYITYDKARKTNRKWREAIVSGNFSGLSPVFFRWLGLWVEKFYQAWRQHQIYRRALRYLDIQADHDISVIEKRLNNNRLFSFDIGTEAALSIGGALEYIHEGFNGIINVFPFTCMPSTVCSAILKPLLDKDRIPYLDAPYDGTYQPNRESALRTFMYQAKQHLEQRQNRTS